eukprot:SAG31_NODE_98_length_25640_cov_9.936744_19_plen_137_part_00
MRTWEIQQEKSHKIEKVTVLTASTGDAICTRPRLSPQGSRPTRPRQEHGEGRPCDDAQRKAAAAAAGDRAGCDLREVVLLRAAAELPPDREQLPGKFYLQSILGVHVPRYLGTLVYSYASDGRMNTAVIIILNLQM